MHGTVIEDKYKIYIIFSCRISNSIIGPNCIIKSQSSINSCQLAMNCIVEKGSNN
jgi:NDP-sugar pyrophosphorylase family protein